MEQSYVKNELKNENKQQHRVVTVYFSVFSTNVGIVLIILRVLVIVSLVLMKRLTFCGLLVIFNIIRADLHIIFIDVNSHTHLDCRLHTLHAAF